MNAAGDGGWTAASVVMAMAVSLGLMLVLRQLSQFGVGGRPEWTLIVTPAMAGSLVLGARHRGTWLLALLLYLPSMMFVLYWLTFFIAIRGGDAL